MSGKLKTKVFTMAELIKMPTEEYRLFNICLKCNAFRLLGIFWKDYVNVFQEINGDIVFNYR
jgi:hypothetical protein